MDVGEEKEDVEKEISLLKRCQHKNIVSYFGSCIRDEKLWVGSPTPSLSPSPSPFLSPSLIPPFPPTLSPDSDGLLWCWFGSRCD